MPARATIPWQSQKSIADARTSSAARSARRRQCSWNLTEVAHVRETLVWWNLLPFLEHDVLADCPLSFPSLAAGDCSCHVATVGLGAHYATWMTSTCVAAMQLQWYQALCKHRLLALAHAARLL
eukprot:390612-Amphidinium_carterae.1